MGHAFARGRSGSREELSLTGHHDATIGQDIDGNFSRRIASRATSAKSRNIGRQDYSITGLATMNAVEHRGGDVPAIRNHTACQPIIC